MIHEAALHLHTVAASAHSAMHGGLHHLGMFLQDQWTQPDPKPAPSGSPRPAHPNLGGCVDSPELPTVVLLGFAIVVAFGSAAIRQLNLRQLTVRKSVNRPR